MYILLLILILTYQLIESVISVLEMKKLGNVEIHQKKRVRFYQATFFSGWIPAIIILFFVILKSITPNDIGLRAITLSKYVWLNIITICIVAVFTLILFYQMASFVFSKAYRQALEEKLSKQKQSDNYYDRIITNIMLPKTKKEKIWFFLVSLTAGIVEEIAWRGTLIFLLQSLFPTLHIIPVILIASAVFGLFHSYQGIYGMIKTSLFGVIFNLLFIISDSLIPGIIIHFLFDFSSAFLFEDKKE